MSVFPITAPGITQAVTATASTAAALARHPTTTPRRAPRRTAPYSLEVCSNDAMREKYLPRMLRAVPGITPACA